MGAKEFADELIEAWPVVVFYKFEDYCTREVVELLQKYHAVVRTFEYREAEGRGVNADELEKYVTTNHELKDDYEVYIFAHGKFVGGYDDLKKGLEDGTISPRLR